MGNTGKRGSRMTWRFRVEVTGEFVASLQHRGVRMASLFGGSSDNWLVFLHGDSKSPEE